MGRIDELPDDELDRRMGKVEAAFTTPWTRSQPQARTLEELHEAARARLRDGTWLSREQMQDAIARLILG